MADLPLNTSMSDTKAEIARLLNARTEKEIRKARWANVYRLRTQGLSFEDIGRQTGTSKGAAAKIFNRAAVEHCKQPGFQWPIKDGKSVCDELHPMPKEEHAADWHHAQSRPCKPRSVLKPKPVPTRGYCPVCKRVYAYDSAAAARLNQFL